MVGAPFLVGADGLIPGDVLGGTRGFPLYGGGEGLGFTTGRRPVEVEAVGFDVLDFRCLRRCLGGSSRGSEGDNACEDAGGEIP